MVPSETDRVPSVIGRSSVTLQGVFIPPGLIDSDFKGQIQAMVWTPSPPVTVPAGSNIAQLILFRSQVKYAADQERGAGGFGSTGQPETYWMQKVSQERPLITCVVKLKGDQPNDIKIRGMMDTGPDVTIIAQKYWLHRWPTTTQVSAVAGVGRITSSVQSTLPVLVISPEGQVATVRPYIMPLPFNLWGRDVLVAWGMTFSTSPPFS